MPNDHSEATLRRRERVGVALLIVAAVLWSLNGLFIRKLHNSGLSGWSIAGYRSLFACLFLTLFGWLSWMGTAQFALPYVLFSMGIGRLSAQKCVLLILLEPLLSPVWVWLAMGEVPSISTLVGGGLIFVSVIYIAILDIVRRRDDCGSANV